MKKLIVTVFCAALALNLLAQAPEKITYQAVIRDANSNLVADQSVGVQLRIVQGSPNGTSVYEETHAPTTNANGLLTIAIGEGIVVSGDLSTVGWENGPYFLETSTDPTGGTSYSLVGTSQLMSVPYALHANTASNVFSGDYPDLTNSPQNLSDFNNDSGFLTTEIDGDPANEIQILSISNDTVFLTSGGFVVLPTNADNDPTNEIQVLSISNDTINLSNGGFVVLPTNADNDPTNEIQVLSISNDTINLSNGGFAVLPAGFDGQYSSLSGAPTQVSAFTNDASYLTSEIDADTTNELQTLSISNDSLTISDGNTVAIPSILAQSVWQTAGDSIYYNQGLVGIGTAAPVDNLHTVDSLFATHLIETTGSTQDAEVWLKNPAGAWRLHGDQSDGNKFKLGLWSDYSELGGSQLLDKALVVDTDGHIGIGLDNPCSTCALEVNGNIMLKGAGDFVAWSPDETSTRAVMFADNGGVRLGAQGGNLNFVANSALTNAVRMTLTSSGNLGVGTTSPQEIIHAKGSSTGVIIERTDNNSSPSELAFWKIRGSNIVQDGDNIGYMQFKAWDGANFRDAARISGFVDGTPGTADMPGRLDFMVSSDGSSSVATAMTIRENGSIGIGLTDPCSNCKVEVNGNVMTRTGGDFVAWSPDGTSTTANLWAQDGTARVGSQGGDLLLSASNTLFSNSERVRINTAGQVGIGTGSSISTDANVLLHVKNPVSANTGIEIESGDGHEWQMYAHTDDHWGIYEVSAAASRLIVDAGGNVGIGTLNPTNLLHVEGTTATIISQTDGDGFLLREHTGNNSRGWWGLENNGDAYFKIWDDVGTETMIRSNGFSYFQGGNVGIGTSSPVNSLHVVGSAAGIVSQTDGDGFLLREHSGTNYRGWWGLENNGDAYFKIWDDVGTETMIRSNGDSYFQGGNVGIGTTSPGLPLHIAGNAGLVRLEGTDHCYMEFYPDGPSTRKGYIGFAGATVDDVWLENEISGQHIILRTNAGNVGVNTTSPTAELSVNGSANKTGGGSWAVFSDARLKHLVEPYTDGLDQVLQISTKTFQYNGKAGIADTETRYVGIIAQEMQEIAPYTVREVNYRDGESGETEPYLEFDPSALDFMMVNAIQEMNAKLEAMESRLQELEAENSALQQEQANSKLLSKK